MSRCSSLVIVMHLAVACTPVAVAPPIEEAPDLGAAPAPQPILAGTSGVVGADLRLIDASLFVWLGGRRRAVVDLASNVDTALPDGAVGPIHRKLLDTDGTWQLEDPFAVSPAANRAVELRTGKEVSVSFDAGQLTSIDAQIAVGRNGSRLVRWHLDTGALDSTPMAEPFTFAVASGVWIALVDTSSKPNQIRIYHRDDLSAPVFAHSTAGSVELGTLDGAAERALWSEHGPAGDRMWSYDLRAHTLTPFADDLHGHSPRGNGKLACFVASDGALWVANVLTDQRVRIAGRGAYCDVNGSRVAWIVPSDLALETYGPVYHRLFTTLEAVVLDL